MNSRGEMKMYHSNKMPEGRADYIGKPLGVCKNCPLGPSDWCSELCDAKGDEIAEKYFNWTDEYGNTEMVKPYLTEEEDDEFKDYIHRQEYSGNVDIWEVIHSLRQDDLRRNYLSKLIFEETGVKRGVTLDEVAKYEIENQVDLYSELVNESRISDTG